MSSKGYDLLKMKLSGVLGKYIPNEADLNNLTTYLYKSMLSVLKEVNVREDCTNFNGITELDVEGFRKAVKDISLFTSQRLISEVLSRTYKELRYTTPVTSIDNHDVKSNMHSTDNIQKMASEDVFDIDISSIPKIDRSKLSFQDKNLVKKDSGVPSEFEIEGLMDNSIGTFSQSSDSEDDNFFTGGSFEDLPSISIDLNY